MKKCVEKMSDEELIDVIESPNRYTKAIRWLAPLEIEKRKFPIKKREKIARIIFGNKIKELLSDSLYKLEDFVLPPSSLSQKQKSEIFEREFEDFKLRRNSLNHGLDKYL